jgi:hypothetical protein
MQRNVVVHAIAARAILALGASSAHVSATPTRHARRAGHAKRVIACGIKRWSLKIGTDPDARFVNQKLVSLFVPEHLGRAEADGGPRDERRAGQRNSHDENDGSQGGWGGDGQARFEGGFGLATTTRIMPSTPPRLPITPFSTSTPAGTRPLV